MYVILKSAWDASSASQTSNSCFVALCKAFVILFLNLCISFQLFGGQSKLGPIEGSSTIQCCSFAPYSIEVENINGTFAIEGIEAYFEVRRGGNLIYTTVLDGPAGNELSPGEKFTFNFEVPMAITALDALLELKFVMDSDFDLNTDPTKKRNASVVGCGVTNDVAIQLLLNYIQQNYEQFLPVDAPFYFETIEDALIFFYPELAKPGTTIKNPYGALLATMTAMSYIAVLDWFPRARYEKPVTVVTINSNTQEISTFETLWYPVIHPPGNTTGVAMHMDPFLKQDNIIQGVQPVPVTPPMPLTGTPVSPKSGNGVYALLVSGVDTRNANMNQSFINDVETAYQLLTTNEYGPLLPASAIQTLNGVTRDQLVVQLDALKDQYQTVYFVYSGHATKSGQMCLGSNSSEWMDYGELMTKLYDSNAPDLKVILDCNYSGQLIDVACEDPRSKFRDLEIVTSADAERLSGNHWYLNGSGVKQQHGEFITQLFWEHSNPENDLNRDNKISLKESFIDVRNANLHSIKDQQRPQKKVQLNATFERIKPYFWEAVTQQYGEDYANHANIRINPELLGSGITITSFDEEYAKTILNPTYFAWIDSEPNSLFGKPITYAYMDPINFEVNLDNSIQYWPVIRDLPTYNPFDRDYQVANNTIVSTDPVPSNFTEYLVDPIPAARIGVAIVTGNDERRSVRNAFAATADMVKSELIHEALGPRIPEQNIRVEKEISADSLRKILASMVGNYDKLYFYYIGHGSKHGRMVFANDESDFINYNEFLQGLDDVGATDYSIVLESSASGLMHDAFSAYSGFDDADVDIFTSTGTSSASNLAFHDINDEYTGYGAFSSHMMIQAGDPASNQDEDSNISLKEAFTSMYRENPDIPGGRLVDLQWSQYCVHRHLMDPGDQPLEYEFRDADIRITYKFRSPLSLDITADAVLATSPEQVPADQNVFAISPVRTWNLRGDFSVDPSLKGDLEFVYDAGIDLINSQEGVLGLVSRADTSEEWQAYYPTEYDAGNHTITALNAVGARQWAIARVVDMSSNVSDLYTAFGITISPNPVSDDFIVLHVKPIQPTRLHVSLISLDGKECIAEQEIVANGEMRITLDASDMLPGMYFVKIVLDGIKGCIPVIIQD